jgi:hypothetical protein
MPLTLDTITASEPRLHPYKMADGGGLHLEVTPDGKRYWRFKYRYCGKSNTLSCGVFPKVSIEEARVRRDAFLALLSNNTDPSKQVQTEKAARLAEKARLIAPARFILDNDGALSCRLGQRYVNLSPAETIELRIFLDATRAVIPKESPCL